VLRHSHDGASLRKQASGQPKRALQFQTKEANKIKTQNDKSKLQHNRSRQRTVILHHIPPNKPSCFKPPQALAHCQRQQLQKPKVNENREDKAMLFGEHSTITNNQKITK
jgi:hypothetical protein